MRARFPNVSEVCHTGAQFNENPNMRTVAKVLQARARLRAVSVFLENWEKKGKTSRWEDNCDRDCEAASTQFSIEWDYKTPGNALTGNGFPREEGSPFIYHRPRFQRPPLYGQPRSQGLSSSPTPPLWRSRELGEARPWERGYYTVTVLGWCSWS